MNSIDTKSLRDDDGRMNERVTNLERIAEETAIRLDSLEDKVDGLLHEVALLTQSVAQLTKDVAALAQAVAALAQQVNKLETRVAVLENTSVTKEYLEKALHAMTWRIIGAITLLTGAVWFASRHYPPYPPPAPATAAAAAAPQPAAPAQVLPRRTP